MEPARSLPTAVPEWIGLTREKVEALRFGVVQLTVHDGQVTQIDCTEKTRLPAREARRHD